jgi:hypothetical protein
MQSYSEELSQAIRDYETFLWKKYPQKTVLKMVGDRYKLSATERAMLYRGVVPKEIATRRKLKLIDDTHLKNETLYVDAYNQLLTIGSYFKGLPVFVSLDGMLRDALEIHGKGTENDLPMRAFEIVMSYLAQSGVDIVRFYFDNQVTGFENFHHKLKAYLNDFVLQPEIISSDHVDKELSSVNEGIVATSDSIIIDRSEVKIFDLARATIEYHFWPKFFDLNSIFTL